MFNFLGFLSGVGDIFLPGCSQVFFPIKLRFRGISEPHKNPVQRGESSSILFIRGFSSLDWTFI